MNCPGRHTCWQSRRRYWEGAPRRRAGGEGNPGARLCHMAHRLRFYGEGVSFQGVSGQSFWHLPGVAKMDSSEEDSRRLIGPRGWHLLAFDLSRILPVGDSLLVPCSLPGPPVLRLLMQVASVLPGQDGRLQSVFSLTLPRPLSQKCGRGTGSRYFRLPHTPLRDLSDLFFYSLLFCPVLSWQEIVTVGGWDQSICPFLLSCYLKYTMPASTCFSALL